MSGKLVRQDPTTTAGSGVTDAQRLAEQAGKAGKKKRKRTRQAYDLPQRVIDAVKAWAREEDIAQGDIVAWALVDLLERHRAEPIDFRPHKEHAANALKVAWHLRLPKKWQDEK